MPWYHFMLKCILCPQDIYDCYIHECAPSAYKTRYSNHIISNHMSGTYIRTVNEALCNMQCICVSMTQKGDVPI